jgi:phosphohistidine phosphatase
MHCLLFRHGIAESPNAWYGDEYSRPLTKEGITKTEQAVEGLKRIGIEPTHLLCSPLTRTQQTAEIAKNILTIDPEIDITPELVYDQSPLLLFPILQALPLEAIVMCVGHEPHLGQTAALMLFGNLSPSLSFKKAGSALITFHKKAIIGQGWSGGYPLRSFELCARAKYINGERWIRKSLLKGGIQRGHFQYTIDQHTLFSQKHRGINDPFHLGRG